MKKEKTAIVGGGISGLSLAYFLSPRYSVTIFEREKELGGLAGGFKEKDWLWSVDNFYHHFFSNDKELIALLKELNLSFFFSCPQTEIFFKKKLFPFSSPLHLLQFPYLNLAEKIRLGAGLAAIKTLPLLSSWENKTANIVFPSLMGKKAYRLIWEPLLKGKFSHRAPEITASWLGGRIKKRSSRLGYIKGGFSQLAQVLAKKIKINGGEIKTGQEITSLNQLSAYQKIIVAASPQTFLKIAPKLPTPYRKKLAQNNRFGALNLILISQKPLLKNDFYWLNINDSCFPFVVVVNHTNFVSPRYYQNRYLTYIGGYYPPHHPLMTATKKDIFQQFLPFLKKISPYFNPSLVKKIVLKKNPAAQPIVTPKSKNFIPPFKTPIKNVFLLCMEQTYPWDRGVNYAILNAKKLAKMIK